MWWCPPILSRQVQHLVVTSINSFLAGISSSFSDRRHRIHPHGVVFFPFCSYLLISLSVMMMSSSEVMMMVSSAGLSSSTIKPNSSSWVWVGNKILPMDIASQPYVLWYDCDTFSMDGTEIGLHLLFFFFQLFSMDTAMELTHHRCILLSSFSALHHVYCNSTDTSLLHLLFFFSTLHHGYCDGTDTSSLHLHFFFVIVFFL